nr:MBL fold metallo-hydrolase [Microbacterium pseudoresistens]
MLRDFYLPTDRVLLNINILLVDTGDELVMFDSGVGPSPDWGRRKFGPDAGRLLHNLRAAGVDPADITSIAITHGHPDHAWGLVDDEGDPLFPRATIHMSRVDHEFFTDEERFAGAADAMARDRFGGARRNLLPYSERLHLLEDGGVVVSGIVAMSTPGHTPGHFVYAIESRGETLINWGDLCHHEILLLQHPEWQFIMDGDGSQAIEQRMRILELVDENHYAVLGCHFPFPGLGHIVRHKSGYLWQPTDTARRRVELARATE